MGWNEISIKLSVMIHGKLDPLYYYTGSEMTCMSSNLRYAQKKSYLQGWVRLRDFGHLSKNKTKWFKLKKVIQDEQNECLECLRKAVKTGSAWRFG